MERVAKEKIKDFDTINDGSHAIRKFSIGDFIIIVVLLIMNLGRIMGSNFERLDVFANTQVREYQYQLAIYIYEKGLSNG